MLPSLVLLKSHKSLIGFFTFEVQAKPQLLFSHAGGGSNEMKRNALNHFKLWSRSFESTMSQTEMFHVCQPFLSMDCLLYEPHESD